MSSETLSRKKTAGTSSAVDVTPRIDVRGLTITTAIALAAHDALAGLAVGDDLELLVDRYPAIATDLRAWCRATGHELVDVSEGPEGRRVRIRKGRPHPTAQRVAIVVSSDGLQELLSPLGFALAAALGGAQVAVHLQGPAVRVLAPGFRARLHGPSLDHVHVDPDRFAVDEVVVCEYLSFMEVMRRADVQLCG